MKLEHFIDLLLRKKNTKYNIAIIFTIISLIAIPFTPKPKENLGTKTKYKREVAKALISKYANVFFSIFIYYAECV